MVGQPVLPVLLIVKVHRDGMTERICTSLVGSMQSVDPGMNFVPQAFLNPRELIVSIRFIQYALSHLVVAEDFEQLKRRIDQRCG